ncbi:unnamed protein product, partial [Cyprideis torosa]
MEEKFQDLIPYDFLQLCYYRQNLQNAANASFTYLVKHAEDIDTRINFELYISDANVDTQQLEDLEEKTFGVTFKQAMNSYEKQDHLKSMKHLEQALEEYFNAHDDCRLLCEGHLFDPTFGISSVAEMFLRSFKCKNDCRMKLNIFYMPQDEKKIIDFPALCYSFLYDVHHGANSSQKALENLESWILLDPGNSVAQEQKKLFSSDVQETEVLARN